VSIITMFLFYFTPIVYSESMVPDRWRSYLALNPMTPLIVAWRHLFLSGRVEWSMILYAFLFAVVSVLVGCLVYGKLSTRFAEAL
jgi:lipopolysaccharide transport system permease protein